MDTCPPWSFWEVRGRLVIRVSSLLALVLLKLCLSNYVQVKCKYIKTFFEVEAVLMALKSWTP